MLGFLVGVAISWGLLTFVHHRRARALLQPVDPTVPITEPRIPTHLAILERHKQEHVGVVFIGDSILDYWRDLPWLWDKSFGRFDPSNMGIDSDQTGHVLWRIQNGELDGINPRVVVLLIGTNNIGLGHDDGGLAAVGVGRVAGEIERRLPDARIILLGILPRRDGLAAEVPKCNAVLRNMTDGHVAYFDPGSQLIDSDFADAMHLSPNGFRHLADLLSPEIERRYK
jgi:beta-glucosidase